MPQSLKNLLIIKYKIFYIKLCLQFLFFRQELIYCFLEDLFFLNQEIQSLKSQQNKMKFVFVIAGLCGVAFAGGNDQGRNQDWGQHGSQEHNNFNGDAHGADGRGNGDQAWHAGSNLVLSDHLDHKDQDHHDHDQSQSGFVPNVNQNVGYVTQPIYQQTYQTAYTAPPSYVQTYPGNAFQQAYSTGYVDQNYQTGYPTPVPTVPVVDPNQFNNGYYSDQSGNVYQYQNNGFYNYGPASQTVATQTYSFLPVTTDQVDTYANQRGWSFHKFGSQDEAKKFNDQYRNRRGGNDQQHNDGNQGDHGNDHGSDHNNSHPNDHETAYGVDLGSNLRRDGGRNDHP